MKDLQALMQHIAATWMCNDHRYPELQGKSRNARKLFLVKHSTAHVLKTMGKIAAVTERFDHEGMVAPEDEERLKDASVKLFVNALKLAEEVGLSADDLLKRAPTFIT